MKFFALLLPLAYLVAASTVSAQLYADPAIREKYADLQRKETTAAPGTAQSSEFLEACDYQDIECLRRTTKLFTSKTYAGIPQYDVKQLDPLFISELDYEVNDNNGVFKFKNTTIAGMRYQKLQHFWLYKDEHFVKFSTKAHFEVFGICEISFKKSNKRFAGGFNSKFTGIGRVEYDYESKFDDKGVEHFIPGPEKLSMEFIGEPIWNFDSKLVRELENDAEANATWLEYNIRMEEMVRDSLSLMGKEVYKIAVHNIRAMAKILPKTAFLKNL